MRRLVLSALVVCAAALLVGAAASQRVNPLTQIHAGKTTSADIEAVFGPPASREAATRAIFKPNKEGVKEIIAWFDKDGKVKWARIRLLNDLPSDAAAILFETTGEPLVTKGNAFSPTDDASLTQHYEGGIHVVVANGTVREVWLTGPDDRPSDVAKEAKVPEPETAAPTAAPAAAATPETAAPTAAPEAAPSATGAAEAPAAPVTPSAPGGIERSDFAPPEQPITGPFEYKPGAVLPVAPQGTAPAAAAGAPGATPRFLNVNYVWSAPSQDAANPKGVDAFARVCTLSLKDQTVTMNLTLRPSGSAAAAAATGALGANLSLSDKVLYDNSSWEQARIAVPAGSLPTGQPAFILHWQAECGGLTSYAEAAYSVGAAGAAGAPAPPRAVTMTNLRVEQNAQMQQYVGIWAYGDLGAVNIKDRTLVAEVRFRLPDGTALKPPQGAQGVSGADGALALAQQDAILHDSASWNPFRIFVPYGVFGLPSGTHKLIMTYKASCDDLSAASEQEIEVVVP